ncbi:MAG TPA: sigma-70 family RNA polymerase sigma factor [Gemmata sp.]|nr:sigma-70 family RNA polymerase sigma factor [Gemmata sp.]
MQTGSRQPLGQLARLLGPVQPDATDGSLLEQFLSNRDESAFAALVDRHGPMILGVCRRILGGGPESEDAFQATFLVLVRKAPELIVRSVLGDWLHGVARRVALKARAAVARRRAREVAASRPEAPQAEPRNDWLPLLDEELSRLPEKYRLPVVLCDLQGQTRADAARHLEWPEGTVAARLFRGRALLAKRLLRRSLAIGGLTPILTGDPTMAAIPNSLFAATLRVAIGGSKTAVANPIVAALAESVSRSTAVSRGIVAAMCVALLGVALGGVGIVMSATPPEAVNADALPHEEPNRTPPAGKPDPLAEANKLDGTWVVTDDGGENPVRPDGHKRGTGWIIERGSIIFDYELKQDAEQRLGRYFRVDPTKDPKTIEITIFPSRAGGTAIGPPQRGIYVLEGDRLKLYIDGLGKEQPATFPPAGGSAQYRTLILEREHLDDVKVKTNPGIEVVIRGELKFESGRGYFIDTATGTGSPPTAQVWLRISEDKVTGRLLEGLRGKDVVASGSLSQLPAGVGVAVPPLGMYLDKFEIREVPEQGTKAQERRGLKAVVRGVLKYQNARVEGGRGYNIVFTSGGANPIEIRVWLWYVSDLNKKKLENLLDKEVVASGWLQQESSKNSALPLHAMCYYDLEIEEAPADGQKTKTVPKADEMDYIDRTPSDKLVHYELKGTQIRYYLLQDGKVYPGTIRDEKYFIWHRAQPLLVSEYPFGGPQSRIPLIQARNIDYQTEPIPKGLERMTESTDEPKGGLATTRAIVLVQAVKKHYVERGEWPAKLADVASSLENGKKDLVDPWGTEYKFAIMTEKQSDGTAIERPYVWTERTIDGKIKVYGTKPPEEKK